MHPYIFSLKKQNLMFRKPEKSVLHTKEGLSVQTWEKIKLSDIPFHTALILSKEIQSGPLEQNPSENKPLNIKFSTNEWATEDVILDMKAFCTKSEERMGTFDEKKCPMSRSTLSFLNLTSVCWWHFWAIIKDTKGGIRSCVNHSLTINHMHATTFYLLSHLLMQLCNHFSFHKKH